MGFWDWYAADREAFIESVSSLGVPVVPIGGAIVPIEVAAALAYGQPSGQAGMLVRLLISGSTYQVPVPALSGLADGLNQQAQSAGFGAGPGVGGSFSYRSELDVAQLIIPNVYRVAIEATSGGQAVTNVVGLRGSGSGLAQQAAAAAQTAWKVSGGPLGVLPNTYALLGFRALDLSSANGSIAFIADSTAGGVTTGSKSTNGACALVKWNGGTRSRSSRGRLYFGPILEGQINPDGRTLSTTEQSNISARMGAFRSSLSSSGFTLCVISPTTSSAFDVSSHAVESVIATQRRRIRS